MNQAVKVCPRCAEEVKLAAQVCKHCRHSFVASVPAKFRIGRRAELIIIAVIVALGLTAAYAERIEDHFAPTALAVSLSQLEKEFDSDVAAASAKYAGRPVEFTGKVDSVDERDLRLETIYLLSVHAHMVYPVTFERGSLVRLWCRRVEGDDYIAGGKPVFRRCYPVAS